MTRRARNIYKAVESRRVNNWLFAVPFSWPAEEADKATTDRLNYTFTQEQLLLLNSVFCGFRTV